jgi:HlyD family secretion protein
MLRRLGGLLLVATVGAGAVLLPRLLHSSESGYRTGVVTTQQISQVHSGVVTIEPVTQASVTFPVDGTVASVDVAVGDTVEIGDPLARLDTTLLEVTLRERQADLAEAELVLAVALDGDDPSTITGASTSFAGTATAVAGVASRTGAIALLAVNALATVAAGIPDDIAAAQQAVLEAQQAVDEAMLAAAATVDAAAHICGAVDEDTIEACQAALDSALADQQSVTDAQAALVAAANRLNDLLAEWADELEDQSTTTTTNPDTTTTTVPDTTTTTVPEPPTTSSPPPDDDPGQPPPDDGGSGGLLAGGDPPSQATVETRTPSAEDLIAYQAAVDAASWEVTVAEQALAQASIVSPLAGEVAAINLAVGDDVNGSSETQTIVIEGTGGYEATLMVGIADIDDLAVGQAATLVPDGGQDSLDGEVVHISAVPATTGTTTYQVTVALAGESPSLENGNIGDIDIITGAAASVLAVPTSAISLDGTDHTVTVVSPGGTVSNVEVGIGVVGETWTEITRGDLDAGQQVALADLDEPLPGTATEDAPTGFPDGGFPGGGFAPPG